MCCENLRRALGASATCFDEKTSAEENGRKFTIQRSKMSKETFCRVKVDGCVILESATVERCDYLFYRCKTQDLYFVELKGKDVKKGYEQVVKTIEYFQPKLKFTQKQVSGFIMVSRSPLSSTELQVLKTKFRKEKYGKDLQIHSREWVHKLDVP